MVVFFSNSEDAAADTRADVFDELFIAHLALATGVVEVDNLHRFVFGHGEVQLPHGVACENDTHETAAARSRDA